MSNYDSANELSGEALETKVKRIVSHYTSYNPEIGDVDFETLKQAHKKAYDANTQEAWDHRLLLEDYAAEKLGHYFDTIGSVYGYDHCWLDNPSPGALKAHHFNQKPVLKLDGTAKKHDLSPLFEQIEQNEKLALSLVEELNGLDPSKGICKIIETIDQAPLIRDAAPKLTRASAIEQLILDALNAKPSPDAYKALRAYALTNLKMIPEQHILHIDGKNTPAWWRLVPSPNVQVTGVQDTKKIYSSDAQYIA